MEENESSVAAKPTNPRVSQACERCRSLKTRCLPSERSGICQRCYTAKRDCVWAETPRRPRRVRGPSRISQVEQKIDGLFASLVRPNITQSNEVPVCSAECHSAATGTTSQINNSQQERPVAPGSWLPFPRSFDQQTVPQLDETMEATTFEDDIETDAVDTTHEEYLEKLRKIHNFGDEKDLSQPPQGPFHSTHKNEPLIKDQHVQTLLENGEADQLISDYRSMCMTFPFVPLEHTISAADLHATKPMLFLAIITVASWSNHKQQRYLDELYRKELAHHIFIRPRRTISLLQSVLVYLSRYHFVFSHKTQQIFFMQQTATGLALDLGLHEKSRRRVMDFPGQPSLAQLSVAEQCERQRTFLGCYYLSSMVAGGLRKPNLLTYTEYMGQCGRTLRDAGQYPTDAIIEHLIAIRRLDDQIHDCFYTEETVDLPLSDPRISMNFRFMEGQLEDWKGKEYDEEFQSILELSSAFTDMQLHSIALRAPVQTEQVYTANAKQMNALLATLEACKRYFDTLLAIPVSDYYLIPFSEWFRIPIVVVTLARLCVPSETHSAAQWDVKAAHDRARLDLYLESLCYRMKGLSTYKRTQNVHADFYWAMEMIMDLTKSWFSEKIRPKKVIPNGVLTPDTMQGSSHESGTFTTPATTQITFMDQSVVDTGFHTDIGGGTSDPFGFMRDGNFDMDRFFDAGLWDDETYYGMGFGGGMRF